MSRKSGKMERAKLEINESIPSIDFKKNLSWGVIIIMSALTWTILHIREMYRPLVVGWKTQLNGAS
jgi:hypothetical protein